MASTTASNITATDSRTRKLSSSVPMIWERGLIVKEVRENETPRTGTGMNTIRVTSSCGVTSSKSIALLPSAMMTDPRSMLPRARSIVM